MAEDLDKRAQAILKLLSDDDERIGQMVLEQILLRGLAGEKEIENLVPLASGRARDFLLSARRKLDFSTRHRQLRDRCNSINTLAELEDFCWKLCLWRNPKTPVSEARKFLEEWASIIQGRLKIGLNDEQKVEILASVLFHGEALTGNSADYYDPDNSFLDTVILSRQGIPITLALIYMLVGARAGIAVEGIGTPGHFLAKLGEVYFDPFSGCALIEATNLRRTLLKAYSEQQVDAFLMPLPYRLIALRMVNNLISNAERLENEEQIKRLQEIMEWLQE